MASLTVIVPATDRRRSVDGVVAAVNRASAPPEELIVVDEPLGLGPAAARNLGARRATGDVLVFIDSDVEVHRDAFVRIRAWFAANPDLAAVFGSYDDEPAAGGLVSDFRNLLHHHVHQESAGAATTFWAGLGAVRRGSFVELHGFDEARFPAPSVEDIEFGSRLAAGGSRIELDPAIQGKHLKRWTLGGMLATDLLGRGVPWLRLVLEGRASANALNLGWRHRVSTVTSLVLCVGVLRRRPKLVVASAAVLGVLDRAFYRLLWARGGASLVSAGLLLHVVHRLLSVIVVPLALAGHIRSTWAKR